MPQTKELHIKLTTTQVLNEVSVKASFEEEVVVSIVVEEQTPQILVYPHHINAFIGNNVPDKEIKELSTQTTVNVVGNLISITASYQALSINTLIAFISEFIQIVDSVSFVEGELGIRMINSPDKIDYRMNDDGELIVIADDVANYDIDDDGNLIYTLN
jgi:hypothetical protein